MKGRTNETKTFHQFIDDLDEHWIPIYYADQLRVWAEVFGWDNVEPVVFDQKNFPNESLLRDFCARTNIIFDEKFNLITPKRLNRSRSYSKIKALRHMNSLGLTNGNVKRLASMAMDVIGPHQDFPNQYDEKILMKVSEGNKWLNRNFFADLAVTLPEAE